MLALVELGSQHLGGLLTEGLLDEPAGVHALRASEALRLDRRFTLGADGDLDDLAQAPPPIWITSLTLPSGRDCSKTL